MFNSGLDFINRNIVTKFHEARIITLPSRVDICFSKNLPKDLGFDQS